MTASFLVISFLAGVTQLCSATIFPLNPDYEVKHFFNELHLKETPKENLRRLANDMLSTANLTVDPCDDFFEYACGAWNHNKSLRDPTARAFAMAFSIHYQRFNCRVFL